MRAKNYKPNAVEILAAGQQFVAEAIHHKTGRPYRWSVVGGLLVVPVSELTLVTEAQCREFVTAAAQILLASGAKECGTKESTLHSRASTAMQSIAFMAKLPATLRRELTQDAEAQHTFGTTISALTSRDPGTYRAALAAIPNDDAEYEVWWRVGLACAAALGESGRNDFLAWSRKSKTKHDQERKGYSDKAYTGFLKYCAAGKAQISAGSLIHFAREAGWKSPNPHYIGRDLARWRRAFTSGAMHP